MRWRLGLLLQILNTKDFLSFTLILNFVNYTKAGFYFILKMFYIIQNCNVHKIHTYNTFTMTNTLLDVVTTQEKHH